MNRARLNVLKSLIAAGLLLLLGAATATADNAQAQLAAFYEGEFLKGQRQLDAQVLMLSECIEQQEAMLKHWMLFLAPEESLSECKDVDDRRKSIFSPQPAVIGA